jgi:putative PEP-CTERM system TPR-repeat lipoprotein
MAGVYMANKDAASAAQSLRKALEIQPNLLAAQPGLTELAVRGNRVPDALAMVKEIQTQRPQEAIGFALEGEVQAAARNWAAAIPAYEKALKLAPNASDLAVKLHSVQLVAQKKREADALASSWLRSHPKDVTFMLYMGDRAVAGNDLNAAAGHYQKALDQQPNNPLTLNNLAWVAGKLGRKDALSLVEKADKLAPNNPAILDTWAMLLASEKNFKQAVEVQKRALQIQPDAALYKFNLAQIQVQAGDKAGAKANLQALKQLGDKFNRQAEVDKLLQSL